MRRRWPCLEAFEQGRSGGSSGSSFFSPATIQSVSDQAAGISRLPSGQVSLLGLPSTTFPEAHQAIQFADVVLQEAGITQGLRAAQEAAQEASRVGFFDVFRDIGSRVISTIGGLGEAAVDVAGEVVTATIEDTVPAVVEALSTQLGSAILSGVGIEPAVVATAAPQARTPTAERALVPRAPSPAGAAMADQEEIEIIEAGIVPAAAVGGLITGGARLASRLPQALQSLRRFLPEIGAGAAGGLAGELLGRLDPRGNGGAVVESGQVSRGINLGSGSLYHFTPLRVRFDEKTGEPRQVGGNRVPNSLTLVEDPETGRLEFFVFAGKPTHFSKIGKYPRARASYHRHVTHHKGKHKAKAPYTKHGVHLTQKQLKAGFGGKAAQSRARR